MELTSKSVVAVAALVALLTCESHQAVAGTDPPPAAPSQPSKPDATATTTTPTATPTTPDGAPHVPAVIVQSTHDKTVEDSVLTNNEVKRLQSAGYKQEKTPSGEVLYCRKEDHIGSLVPRKQCVTGPQLKALAEDRRQLNDLVQEKAGVNSRPTPASNH
jgi:hypothetical protein